MKSYRTLTLRAFHRDPGSRRGVALLLVLGCLVLLTALILALIISSQNNLKSSKLYANGSSVKTLADSTVSLVMAQISQATSNGTQVAWASQPGMIRTYDNTGAPKINYRLFSWDTPTISGAYAASGDAAQLSSSATTPWYSSPAVFVDLNQPVADAKGTLHYPIVDGNPSDLASYTTPAPASTSVLTYTPYTGTFNGQSVTMPQIDGFWVIPPNTSAASASGSSPAISSGPAVNSTTTSPSNSTNNDIPMPVKWLYVLKDGTVVAPATSSTGTTVTINAASSTNPIVGRIAYWTDDETNKVNINTASEGSYADTPRVQGVSDFAIAMYPPIQHEIQRYPGHPATTCLSAVLGSLYPVDHSLEPTVASSSGNYTSSKPVTYASYQPYYDLAPKLNFNSSTNLGSQAGTVSWYTGTLTSPTLTPNGLGHLTWKNDRLYNSVDELMFASNLLSDNAHVASTTVTGPSSTRPLTQSSASAVTFNQAFLEKAQFFLTAHSRAPDVNLYNQPRILTWPINQNISSTSTATVASYCTPLDQTIAFCGTVGGLPYYFQRSRNDHPTNDLPGSYTAGAVDITRNRELMDYLHALTNQPVPGFGGTYAAKYPAVGGVLESDQILTEIFDYIRCLDLVDQSTGTATGSMNHPFAPAATAANNYPTVYAGTNGSGGSEGSFTYTNNAGQGQVVPIYDTKTKTKGFGRFPTVQEVAIMFFATGWNDGAGGKTSDVNYQGAWSLLGGTTNTYTTGALTGSVTPLGFYSATNNPALGTPTGPLTAPSFGTIQPPLTAMPTIPDANIQVQAVLLISMFDPSLGKVDEYGTYSVQVTGLGGFQWGTGSTATATMNFPSSAPADISNMAPSLVAPPNAFWGGNLGFRNFLLGMQGGKTPPTSTTQPSQQYYPFLSGVQNFPYTPSTPATPGTFTFSGGKVTVSLLLPTQTPGWPVSGWPLSNPETFTPTRPPVQTLTFSFPQTTLPLPTYAVSSLSSSGGLPRLDRGNFNNRTIAASASDSASPEFITGTTTISAAHGATGADVVRSVRAFPGDMRMIAGQVSITDAQGSPAPDPGYFDYAETRISAAGLTNWKYSSSTQQLVHSLRESVDYPFGGALLGQLVPGVSYYSQPASGAGYNTIYSGGLNTFCGAGGNAGATGALMWKNASGTPTATTIPGDWDNGFGVAADGSFINKPDEGSYYYGTGNNAPYFTNTWDFGNFVAGTTYFSPNRLMAGPGMFGSLPTGVLHNEPWQTLLFCPNPAAGPSHPGLASPPDHLMLDLFNMPVVEPYPISEPLSTAGRINMNYQIVPFTYIERSTGVRAVLKAERMTVVPDNAANVYKFATAAAAGLATGYDFRVPINSDQTMLGFDNYFAANNDIFRSASQICTMFLYPARDALLTSTSGPLWDSANANILKFWNGNTTGAQYNVSTTATSLTHYLTGDNSREKPYADIYPRLTTKSNTFTIHYYVQTLQKIVNSNPTLWNDVTDKVTGEYRGSTTVERYVNSNDSTLPDFAAQAIAGTPQALDAYYKFRVVNERQFAP